MNTRTLVLNTSLVAWPKQFGIDSQRPLHQAGEAFARHSSVEKSLAGAVKMLEQVEPGATMAADLSAALEKLAAAALIRFL